MNSVSIGFKQSLSAACAIVLAVLGYASANATEVPKNVSEVIAEATRRNDSPDGRPLPLASSWATGMSAWGLTGYPHYAPRPYKPGGLDLHKQLELLKAGHHWLPVVSFPQHLKTRAQDPKGSTWFNHAGYYGPWDTLARWRIPLTVRETQFDAPLYNQMFTTDQWVKLPPSINPCVIRNGVHIQSRLAANTISTTGGTNIVRVSLPGVAGINDKMRIWFVEPLTVGGLRLDGERWNIISVETLEYNDLDLEQVSGSSITFAHKRKATATAKGGAINYEIAEVISAADPIGPMQPWYEVGQWWMQGFRRESWKDLWARYPEPSRIIFLSNNEGRLPSPKARNDSKRFVDAYGGQTDYASAARTVKEGYAARFKRLFQGMRDTMPAPWANVSTMVAYNAVFSWYYGRWQGWREHAMGDDLALSVEANSWDGASPEYYLNPWQSCTDHTIFSPQTAFMNVKWQLDLVYRARPNFWYEMSTWDGYPKKREWFAGKNTPFTAERYKAWLQYGMWLTRPRVVREFRDNEPLSETGVNYFKKFLEAVDDVYAEPVKTRFWRHGTVVPNRSRSHPYQVATLEQYDGVDRWFNLNTSLDVLPPPAAPVPLATEVPIWSLVLLIGEAPRREWLLYAYSPLRDRQAVTITIPDFRDVTLDVPQAGTFLHIDESVAQEKP